MKEYIETLEALSKNQLMLLLARQQLVLKEGIAIVGMSCRFPGGIDSPAQFWQALRAKRIISEEGQGIPCDSQGQPRWNSTAADLAPLADLLRKGCYLDAIDLFDARRFGISDEEAIQMDPQQRLLLTCAALALADAGISQTTGLNIGVFAAAGTADYPLASLRNHLPYPEFSAYMGTGSSLSALAARVAVGLRCNGPAITIDTACSSALTATHLAAASLRRRECDIAIVGAVHLLLSPFTHLVFSKAGLLSARGHCRPFRADADGYVRAEGCGVLVLKRQTDTLTQPEVPYAIIRGSSIYQHGDRDALGHIATQAQVHVIKESLHEAELDPLAIACIEAQANGAKLGGIIEIEQLAKSYHRNSPQAPPLVIGSCKANLGYLETASGAASLIKTALALSQNIIPPQPGTTPLDPDIAWDRMALDIAQTERPWPEATKKLAGVSAFGFTGTNGHILLEGLKHTPRPLAPPRPQTGQSYWLPQNRWS